mmetsp:Transcript_31696/g.30990  ORF Transcript_31696/g.30990 Transcript_31696/m.30990 type:complete len:152 (+) Transcript_31696:752-1207(+)
MTFDYSERFDLIHCGCALFDPGQSDAYCQWPGLSDHRNFFNLAYNFYQHSAFCHRSLLTDNPLYLDFQKVRQCTTMPDSEFLEFVSFADKWIYKPAYNSTHLNATCLNTFARTGSSHNPEDSLLIYLEDNTSMNLILGSLALAGTWIALIL